MLDAQVVSGLTVKIADLGNACWVRVVPPNYFNLKQNYLLHPPHLRSTIISQRTSRPGSTEALKFFWVRKMILGSQI